jgi:tetratricopeptide (TPR) repeat protein/LPS sulfotransferase NodH
MDAQTARLIAKVERLMSRRAWAEAEAVAAKAGAADPSSFEAAFIHGVALSRLGAFADALSRFQRAAELRPNDFDAVNFAGLSCRRLGDEGRACGYFQRALELRPTDAEAHFNLAWSLCAVKRVQEAFEHIVAAREIDPGVAHYWSLMADVNEEMGCDELALAARKRAIAIKPTERDWLRLMDLEIGSHDPRAAVNSGVWAVQNGLHRPAVHLKLAQAYSALLEEDRANVHRAQALELDPNRAETYLDVGFAQQAWGDFSAAESSFKRAIELDASEAIGYFGISSSRKMTAADQSLLDRMTAMASDESTSLNRRAHLFYGLGKAYDDLGEPATAIQFFDAANAAIYALKLARRPFDRGRLHAETERRLSLYGPELIARMEAVGDPSPLPVVVLGMMRSGTTLMEQVLSRHPQIGGMGEVHFWSRADRSFLAAGEPEPDEVSRCGRQYVELLASSRPNNLRVVDKNPSNALVAGLIHAALPNARIIHMIRDPADTALSMWMTHVTQPPEFCCDRENIVAMYREYWRSTQRWREILPARRYLEVSYEELVSDPEANIRRVLAFLGMDWSDACLNPQSNRSAVETPSMWQVRQPFNSSSVGKWRRYAEWVPEFVALREFW